MHRGGQDIYHFGPAAYASEMVLPSSCVVPIRKDMPLELAALIGCSVTTGVGAVTRTARVPAGAAVAVFGCGGIGLNVVQGARLSGAQPIIAVDVSQTKLETAGLFGATHLVDATREDPAAAILRAHPAGIDYAFVTIGRQDTMDAAWSSLSPAGACVVLGRMATGARMEIDPERLYGRENRLLGSRYGSARPVEDFSIMVELYLAGKLMLEELVTRRYALDEVQEAHRALAAGELARGLIVHAA